MKLLWTWVQSAKWPLKMTRKQANRRLFREQWPRRRYKVRRVREFYEPREHLSEEYSLLSSEETLRGIVFQRHDHSEGTGQPNSKKAESSWTSGCGGFSWPSPPSCPHALAALPPWHQTQPKHDHSLPWTWCPWAFFFFSWLFIPEVSAGYFPVGFLSQRLVKAIFQLALYPRG